MTIAEARLRFRATLELDGVPPFWEDQLFGAELRSVVRFHIGEVAFEGSYPCIRCPIPARDPHTGADIIGFQKRFAQPTTPRPSSALVPRRPLRAFLLPCHQHAHPLHRIRQASTPRRLLSSLITIHTLRHQAPPLTFRYSCFWQLYGTNHL
jgi:hypothetical protein